MQGGAFRKRRDPPIDTDEWKGGDPNAWAVCMSQYVFLLPKFRQNSTWKKMILTDTKDFSWEKWSKFAKFWKEKIQIARFLQ
jgi:hypothetical protein